VCTAVVASGNAVSDPTGARKLGNASIGMSVAGIVVTIVIVIIVVAVAASAPSSSCSHDHNGICYDPYSPSCLYKRNGICYNHKKYVGTYGICSGFKDNSGYCYY